MNFSFADDEYQPFSYMNQARQYITARAGSQPIFDIHDSVLSALDQLTCNMLKISDKQATRYQDIYRTRHVLYRYYKSIREIIESNGLVRPPKEPATGVTDDAQRRADELEQGDENTLAPCAAVEHCEDAICVENARNSEAKSAESPPACELSSAVAVEEPANCYSEGAAASENVQPGTEEQITAQWTRAEQEHGTVNESDRWGYTDTLPQMDNEVSKQSELTNCSVISAATEPGGDESGEFGPAETTLENPTVVSVATAGGESAEAQGTTGEQMNENIRQLQEKADEHNRAALALLKNKDKRALELLAMRNQCLTEACEIRIAMGQDIDKNMAEIERLRAFAAKLRQ